MSTPRFLTLPPGVRRVDIPTARGTLAALEALPTSGSCERQTAVLVPGFTGSKEDFIALLQTLAHARRRVIAIDMRGQYESPGPDDPAAYALAELGVDILALIDALDSEGVHLLGHSMGGLVTREAVITDAAGIASYTIMSSGPGAIAGARESDARRLITALQSYTVEEIWEHNLSAGVAASTLPQEVKAFLYKRMVANTPAGLAQMAHEVTSAADRVAELAAVPVPKLVLYGENDDAWPPQVQAEMAEQLGASRVVVPGAAHSPNVEAPETTASALTDFWNACERGGALAG
ncbi:alpha/beta fold hydrolase [Allonocardiopsis opalescens]|uniref:Pimeloyl-ACP methyl ester carboxylesterase n=1 Tax=Allonocardiopsis opalescens TaxID=1144618 RepID=A0A2T0QDI0_9ACTN|nr:alpha/beta hydrolase [Allonocardiopsis opalescens]PRY01979.1 pimeloyl-ACP methyl ester carboxylesterase [Allonocardiopsis opalescens]